MDPFSTIGLILLVVIFFAQVIETSIGFGATVIALSIGVQFVPLGELVVVLVLNALVQSTWLAVRGRHVIEWRIIFTRLLPGVVVGFPLGILGGIYWDESILKMFLGGLVIFVALKELSRSFLNSDPGIRSKWVNGAFLAGGGFFHGLFATAGPMVVLYASRRLPKKGQFRATLAVLWLMLNFVMLGSFLVQGRVESSSVLQASVFLPALAGGILLGEFLHARTPEKVFRAVVHVLLLVIGVLLFV
jgi:uncharacterized membrane protein YfcA